MTGLFYEPDVLCYDKTGLVGVMCPEQAATLMLKLFQNDIFIFAEQNAYLRY